MPQLLVQRSAHPCRCRGVQLAYQLQAQAVQALALPERLPEIAAERNLLLSRLGELKVMAAHPLPGAALIENRRLAAHQLGRQG